MQYACGETLVCDSLEIAKLICYERNEKVKGTPTAADGSPVPGESESALTLASSGVGWYPASAVSLDGTLIHKSGMITGGISSREAKAKTWEEKEVTGMECGPTALQEAPPLLTLRRAAMPLPSPAPARPAQVEERPHLGEQRGRARAPPAGPEDGRRGADPRPRDAPGLGQDGPGAWAGGADDVRIVTNSHHGFLGTTFALYEGPRQAATNSKLATIEREVRAVEGNIANTKSELDKVLRRVAAKTVIRKSGH